MKQQPPNGPSRHTRLVIMALAAWGLSLQNGTAQTPRPQRITQLPNHEIFVHKVTDLGDLLANTNTIDWSGPNNRLIIDKRGLNQYYNVFSVTPEGFRLKPLTLAMDPTGTARQHSGNANWIPGGDVFIFTSQNRGSTDYRRSIPGMGWHCNLWLADKDGNKFWQLTNLHTSYNSPQGIAMPHFSPDGKRVFWTGKTGKHSTESPWEQRALYLADFAFNDGRPELSNRQEFQPGKQRDFYESYGFSPDGNRIYFAGNLEENQPWYGMNIYALDKGATEPVNLTQTPRSWDRFASISPDGRKIVWSSSADFNIRYLGSGGSRWQRYLRTELWIMDANGQNGRKLTNLNTPGSPEYVGRRAFVGDTAWSPDGNRIALVLHYETRNFDVDSKVLMVELGKGPVEEKTPENNQQNEGKNGSGKKRRPAPKITPALPKW